MCRRPKQLVLTGWKGSVRSLVQSVRQLPLNCQMFRRLSAPPRPTTHTTSLVDKGMLHMLLAFPGSSFKEIWSMRIPAAPSFIKLTWVLHNFKITGIISPRITQAYVLSPHLPPPILHLPLSPSLWLNAVTLSLTLSQVITLPHSGPHCKMFSDWKQLG